MDRRRAAARAPGTAVRSGSAASTRRA